MSTIERRGKATTITYDAGGNQLSVRDLSNVGADMLYDALCRNTQRTDKGYARAGTSSPSQLSQSWSLTSVGDWSSTTINGTAHTRTHGPTHELLTNKIGSGSTQNVTHDVKGNMTSIPANLSSNATPLALTWDFDNQMKSADIDA